MFCAGEMTDRVTIQQKVTTRGANGEELVSWSAVATVRAGVRPLRGREFVLLRAAQSELSLEVKIRYRTGINTEMRLLWRSNPYRIEEMIPGGYRNKTELTLMCAGPSEDA